MNGSVREALAMATSRLAEAGVADAERETSWLMAHVLNCSVGTLRLRGHEPLDPALAGQFAALVDRRAAREPIQYILGTEEFLGMTFRVTPAVLIPRLDTETLVRNAAERLAGLAGPVRVADIGTGSGAIAVGVAALVPQARVVATDLSPEALAVAAQNAASNGVAERVEFRQGDLTGPLAGDRFQAILSNPPYIDEAEVSTLDPEVRAWEPRLALTPGPDGLSLYRRLIAEAPAFLLAGGFLGVEVGIGQARTVSGWMMSAGYRDVAVYQDSAGIERAVFGHQ